MKRPLPEKGGRWPRGGVASPVVSILRTASGPLTLDQLGAALTDAQWPLAQGWKTRIGGALREHEAICRTAPATYDLFERRISSARLLHTLTDAEADRPPGASTTKPCAGIPHSPTARPTGRCASDRGAHPPTRRGTIRGDRPNRVADRESLAATREAWPLGRAHGNPRAPSPLFHPPAAACAARPSAPGSV